MKKKIINSANGENGPFKEKSFTSLMALGLSSLLHSLAIADEAVDNLKKVLEQQEKDNQTLKNRILEGYSPVADLRSNAKSKLGQTFEKLNSLSYTEKSIEEKDIDKVWQSNVDSNIAIKATSFGDSPTLQQQTTNIASGATVRYILTPTEGQADDFDTLFLTFGRKDYVIGGGGNLFVDLDLSKSLGSTKRGVFYFWRDSHATFDVNLYIDLHSQKNYNIGSGVFSLGWINGTFHNAWNNVLKINKNLGVRLDDKMTGINMIFSSDSNARTTKANALAVFSYETEVYINAREDGSVYDTNNVIQIENGSLYFNFNPMYPESDKGSKSYINFSNPSSYLIGDLAITGQNDSTISSVNLTFGNGAFWKGNAILDFNDSKDSSVVSLDHATWTGSVYDIRSPKNSKIILVNSSLEGDLNITNDAHSSYLFNQSDFKGSIKGGSWSNQSFQTNGGGGTNSTIVFTNTAGRTFGDGNNNIVDQSFRGDIVGSFNVSADSTTTIKGGSDGSKGFLGSGKNLLTFDFRNNAKSGAEGKQFTISGGNADSVYVMSGFQQKGSNELDLSSLDNNGNSLYKKLENAGIKIKVEAQNGQSGHLNGTLLFQKTNIKVSDNGNALFATKENIVGSNNDLNGLAMGAMFGNAIWNDANNDGYITKDEIAANSGGVNYKLSSGSTSTIDGVNGVDERTSTGNIGKASDGVKKKIGFIFANGTGENQGYVFGGDKQGYGGMILGGTEDSKYYFANAGYINRSQVEDAKGDLVLFNTAFRGDLGVKNKDVSIILDFSENRNGLRSETEEGNANIVGSGSKNITFNFTGNTKKEKYAGAVVGDATKANVTELRNTVMTDSADSQSDSDKATYTMLNLKKADSDGSISANDGMLTVSLEKKTASKTLIDAIRGAGLTNFNSPSGNNLGNSYGKDSAEGEAQARKDLVTDISELSKTSTTLSLRGTSLDATNIGFDDYVYDFAFGTGLGEIEGVTIEDSKLKGTIDLSLNNNKGHKIVMRGDSIEGEEATIKFNKENFGGDSGGIFSYNDLTAQDSVSPKTLKLTVEMDNANYLRSGDLVFTKTNLEADKLYANENVKVNLDFRDGRTLKIDEMGLKLAGDDNLVVHGRIQKSSKEMSADAATLPTIKVSVDNGYSGKIELINTGAQLVFKNTNQNAWSSKTAHSFDLRGTSLDVQGDLLGGQLESESFNMVFAKGDNVETTVERNDKEGSGYYKITEEGSNNGHSGKYENGVYDGNYIAESQGKLKRFNTANSGYNLTFVGKDSHDFSGLGNDNNNPFRRDSSMAFANAGSIDSQKIQYLTTNKDSKSQKVKVILEGTNLTNGNSLVAGNDVVNVNFNMTFIKESNAPATFGEESIKYVNADKYRDLATTNANGALKDSILKVAESKLDGGVDFKNASFNVLFVGDGSQSLSDSAVFKGGSASSVVTFRDSNLNAGNDTSSIQNIKGTIAFDLSHGNEDMQISGTLSNMFGNGSNESYNGTGKYQTNFSDDVSFDQLVFVSKEEIANAHTLESLSSNGQYFGDIDTFGNLANQDYSALGSIKDLDTSSSSSFTLAGGSTIALKGANQEIVFVGERSHGFDDDGILARESTKLGDSTGSTLTFIDAGELKVANLVNASSSGQQGRGTINLVGSTSIELKEVSSSSGLDARNTTQKTLTLYDAGSSDQQSTRAAITGEGITINAIFTGTRTLGEGVEIKNGSNGGASSEFNGAKASNVNIGQKGEKTIYHLLFDYTDAMQGKENLGFGQYQVYQGKITGLTSDSVIKFKNSGYLNGDQIANTDAIILLDNTQLKSDFRGDYAVLDYRQGKEGIAGNILTSDVREATGGSTPVLSQKVLTFDFTGTTAANENLKTHHIQAGYKVAPEYSSEANSILTFQNAPKITLANQEGSRDVKITTSTILKGIASATGFVQLASAKIDGSDFNTSNKQGDQKTYILSGTELVLQGTSIDASGAGNAIVENDYNLNLSFDQRESGRGMSGLEEELYKSSLIAHSITLGSAKQAGSLGDESKPLGLSLSFHDAGSLVGETKEGVSNVLSTSLANNARFNLSAESSNGYIGTVVFNNPTILKAKASLPSFGIPTREVSKDSSLSISAGSLGFVGDFVQSDDLASAGRDATAGAINVAFTEENKTYGILSGRGEMNISIQENALLDKETARKLGYDGRLQDINLLIDASNATGSNIVLAHSEGTGIGVVGKTISSSGAQSAWTNLNLDNTQGSVILDGAFDIKAANINFDGISKAFALSGDVFLNVANGASITLKDAKTTDGESKTLIINSSTKTSGTRRDFTFINLDSNITVELKSLESEGTPNTNDWGSGGDWNFRGTNLKITSAFWSEGSAGDRFQNYTFAKGAGTETTKAREEKTTLKLSELTTDDKINESSLTGELKTTNSGNNVKNLILKNAKMTFIGKDSFGMSGGNAKIDGTNGKITFGFYNGLVKSGNVIFDNTNNGEHANLGKNANIQDVITLRGTDTFNLSVRKSDGAEVEKGQNNSTIDAVFINGTQTPKTSIIGERYIDANSGDEALKATLAQYATTNAGGALSESILKTMESKAYGNIALEDTVAATMKFIGEDSHSFDGKVIVKGSGASAEFYQYTKADGNLSTPSTQASDWNQIKVDDRGNVSLTPVSNPTAGSGYKYAQLIGGNVNSRFDFDHTTVALDLVKFAGGKTIVYNSNISGQIAVQASGGVGNGGADGRTGGLSIAETSSTTLFFNAKMGTGNTLDEPSSIQNLTEIAKQYIDYHYTSAETGLGINLDFTNTHQMTKSNLANSSGSKQGEGKYALGTTQKQTNIILIGKDSVKTENLNLAIQENGASANNKGQSIDLSFLPANTAQGSGKYSYTIISGGDLDGKYINSVLGSDSTENTDVSGVGLTVFGKSKVTLVDTYVVGERNFAQVGFIDAGDLRNQKSSWGGGEGIDQFLIFDFHNGANNQSLNNGSADAVNNSSHNSRYIFTNIGSSTISLSDGVNLRSAINAALKSNSGRNGNNDVIGSNVRGYLGLRGVSVEGSINEDLAWYDLSNASQAINTNKAGNSVDIVFNSTEDISYVDGFDESGEHTFKIKHNGKNEVANITGENTGISGYAIFKASNGVRRSGTSLEIKGSAHKDIVFIGEKSIQDGQGNRAFESLKISGGSKESRYTFYAVGELSDGFLQGVKLQKSQEKNLTTDRANFGTFVFAGGTQITGNIDVDASEQGGAKLVFDDVVYRGTLSGNLEKDLKFAQGSNHVKIMDGGNASIYDFSALSGGSINLDIDFVQAIPYANSSVKYGASVIRGFENGNLSLIGSLKLAKSRNEVDQEDYSNSFAFNNQAKWIVTDNSRVMNLSLSNEGSSFNLDLASAKRMQTSLAAQSEQEVQVNKDLRVLEVGTLSSDGGQVLLGTMIDQEDQSKSMSDKIKASVIGSGTLYITAQDASITSGNFDTTGDNAIVLVAADSSYGEIKGAERKEGLSYVMTTLEHQVNANGELGSWEKVEDESAVSSSDSHRWVLSGFDTRINQELVDESGFLVSNPYRMLMIETNNLNKRMGDLRDNDYNQGAWIRVFNGRDSGEGSQNLYTNIQLGYDYATAAIGSKNYTGAAFSTSIVDINGKQYSGKANTYSVAVYNSHIADDGLYVDTIAKYLYTDQKLTPSGSSESSFGNHALSLGVEVGYRVYMGESNFYFESQAELIGGLIFGVKDIDMGMIGGRHITGELKTTTALNARVGVVQGYSLKTQSGFGADFRFGTSLVNEFVSEKNSVRLYDGITEARTSIGNDTKVVLNVGTSLILTDQWRVYLDAEKSFGGSRNTDYQANVGARFSFGDKVNSLPKSQEITPLKLKDKEEIKKVQETEQEQ
ncbi:hypothetical protein [Helicobacter kayseriensis]|uniref:hypothetical protein n=1 Tax=Helicobacter kayseriensis TaxID=2905877 RepID=UPI001E29B3E2|nr:hypothetical protein [Helicobacter kayseriensis]MCE3047399.1 hypothetical protein [Helicobacter kayseriensis]MCE3048930.1 hypothetical protein [Helicobacter kayseriensis]